MPLRFLENGLQDADGSPASIAASVCSASQAFSEPKDSGASEPPASARSSSPEATRRQASPIATADDEQAVEYVRFGPRSPCSMPIQPAGALCMPIRTVYGLMRSEASLYSVW